MLERKADPGSGAGTTGGRKAPRWTIAFLRALERTGSAEEAARDAGIERSTAYHRRSAHADFAAAWDEALARRAGAEEQQVQERAGFWERVRGKVTPKMLAPATPPPPASAEAAADCPPAHPRLRGDREELLASTALGGKMVKAGPGRFTKAAEQRFFEELAATANVRRACAAAGVSQTAIYARRMKRPDFKAKWDAVLETGRAAIEMHLVETAKKSFDPSDLDVDGVQPKVSVAEAIRIVQLHGSKGTAAEAPAPEPSKDDIEAVRERVFGKLQRLRKRERPKMLAEGWSHDEAHDCMVPPGWSPPRSDEGDSGESSATEGE